MRALAQYEKGLRLAPGNADARLGRRMAESGLGRWEAAARAHPEAQRLDPARLERFGRLGDPLLQLRRYPEAREVFDRGLALSPERSAWSKARR